MAKFSNKNTGQIVEAYRAPWDNYEEGFNLRQGDWVVESFIPEEIDPFSKECDDYIEQFPYDKFVMSNLVFSRDFELLAFELTGKSMGSLCAMEDFWINGIYGAYEDFGDKRDEGSHYAEDYACGDMQFTRMDSTAEVLAKYNINDDQYDAVCDLLTEELSFGNCGWCV